MILRRITEHVKTQNWFAFGIDFFCRYWCVPWYSGCQLECNAGEQKNSSTRRRECPGRAVEQPGNIPNLDWCL